MTIPTSVKEIGPDAFWNCKSLKRVMLASESRLEKIGVGSFYNTGIASIIVPKSVTLIGERAFGECRLLQSVVLQGGLEHIGAQCFSGSGLYELVIPKTVKFIGKDALGCLSLRWVDVEEGCQVDVKNSVGENVTV